MLTGRTRTDSSKNAEAGRLRGPLNDLITERMRRQGILTVKEFADKYTIGRSTLYDLIRGRADGTFSNPSMETLERLADALERPAHELLYLINPTMRGADMYVQPRARQVPVYLAGHVGAGPEQLRELGEFVYVEEDFARNRDLVAFRVRGNSMAGGKRPIHDGDVVIVDRKVGPEINAPVVARLLGNGYVVKRLRPNGVLDSANPDYVDPDGSLIPADRVEQLVGRVVRVQGDV